MVMAPGSARPKRRARIATPTRRPGCTWRAGQRPAKAPGEDRNRKGQTVPDSPRQRPAKAPGEDRNRTQVRDWTRTAGSARPKRRARIATSPSRLWGTRARQRPAKAPGEDRNKRLAALDVDGRAGSARPKRRARIATVRAARVITSICSARPKRRARIATSRSAAAVVNRWPQRPAKAPGEDRNDSSRQSTRDDQRQRPAKAPGEDRNWMPLTESTVANRSARPKRRARIATLVVVKADPGVLAAPGQSAGRGSQPGTRTETRARSQPAAPGQSAGRGSQLGPRAHHTRGRVLQRPAKAPGEDRNPTWTGFPSRPPRQRPAKAPGEDRNTPVCPIVIRVRGSARPKRRARIATPSRRSPTSNPVGSARPKRRARIAT